MTTNPIEIAKRVLAVEIDGLKALAGSLDAQFTKCVELIRKASGHTVLAGVGKSGHVARKIAATLASTGTPSLFIHPTEASHGDMGMIKKGDIVIALSRSGETNELADMLHFCKRFDIPLIAITANLNSALGKAATYILQLPDTPEACGVTGAPTTSTTLQMALGDALAVALLETRGFTASDFKNFHPGGTLGAKLSTVANLMHAGDAVPLVKSGADMETALSVLSDKGFGCVGIVDSGDKLVGIITDGDIRRHLSNDLSGTIVDEIMTRSPKTVTPQDMSVSALRLMTVTPPKVMQVFVVDNDKPIGILHMHDLLRAGVA